MPMDFENCLLTGIPLAEASSFFLRVKTGGRRSLRREEQRLAEACVKKANGMAGGMPGAPLPATAQGQNPIAVQPMPLPAAAMGKHGDFEAAVPSKKSPHEAGKERAHAALAAEFEREKHHRHEQNHDLLGRAAGAVLGGTAMHRYGKGNALATLGGVAVGSHLGGAYGRHTGAVVDRREFNKAATAMKLALEGGLPIDPGTQAYLATEQAGQQAEEANQNQFLHAKLQEMQQAAATAGEQLMQLQQQQAGSEQQQQMMQQQVSDALMQQQAAQDQVLQQQQAATAMRMAFQQLRGQMLELAASDPPNMTSADSAQAAAQAANAGGMAPPAPATGPAGQAVSAQPAPGAATPEGEGPMNANAQGPSPGPDATAAPTKLTGQKEAAFLASPFRHKVASPADGFDWRALAKGVGKNLRARGPHAAVGAGALGLGTYAASQMSNDPLRKKVEKLEAVPDRTRAQAVELAMAQARLTLGEYAEKHPYQAAGSGALTGAAMGAMQGPALASELRDMGPVLKNMGRSLRSLVGK